MNFQNQVTRDALMHALSLLQPTRSVVPLLLQVTGQAEARLDNAEKCIAAGPHLAQYVVSHLSNKGLMSYLADVPRGLAGCLIPLRGRQVVNGVSGHYFPNRSCRQLLLKTVADRCCSLPLASYWQSNFNHQLPCYTEMLSVRDHQNHWTNFQQEVQYYLMSLQVLDRADLLHLQDLTFFLHDNGLIGQMDMELSAVFRLFFNDVASLDSTLTLGPLTFADVVSWSHAFFLWITVESQNWPNRQLYTSTMAFLLYSHTKARWVQPLNGMLVRTISPALARNLRYGHLDSMTLLANLEKSQFRSPSHCWVDLRHQRQGLQETIDHLAKLDAAAYPPTLCPSKMSKLLHKQTPGILQLMQDQPEAAFFHQLAEAESSSQLQRHYDVLHLLSEILTNYHFPNILPHNLHPKKFMPEVYLLLAKTLARVYASDHTILVCLQQARLLVDMEKVNGSLADSIQHQHDQEFALAILVVLNQRGLLQQAAIFFQHVMEENGPSLLKQSVCMLDFCLEYIQHTAMAWVENQLAFMVGFQQYHSKCTHTRLQLRRTNNTDTRLQHLANTVMEIKDLIALNQRFIRTNNLTRPVNVSVWGVTGTAGQETTLECLSLKAKFYQWLIQYVTRRTYGDGGNPHHEEELTLLMEQYQTWAKIVDSLHPLYLEVCCISIALDGIWNACMDVATNRTRHTTYNYEQFVHLFNVAEAWTGTFYSDGLGNMAFRLYLWLSVGCGFSGNGRCDPYSANLLSKAGITLLRSSRGHNYRLPLISLLLNHLGSCSKLAVNVNLPPDQHQGTGKIFPSTQATSKMCQCTLPPKSEKLQSHEENRAPLNRFIINHGFRALSITYPLLALFQTRKTAPGNPAAAEGHNIFLTNLLRQGTDGTLFLKAYNYATGGSIKARDKRHNGCTK